MHSLKYLSYTFIPQPVNLYVRIRFINVANVCKGKL